MSRSSVGCKFHVTDLELKSSTVTNYSNFLSELYGRHVHLCSPGCAAALMSNHIRLQR